MCSNCFVQRGILIADLRPEWFRGGSDIVGRNYKVAELSPDGSFALLKYDNALTWQNFFSDEQLHITDAADIHTFRYDDFHAKKGRKNTVDVGYHLGKLDNYSIEATIFPRIDQPDYSHIFGTHDEKYTGIVFQQNASNANQYTFTFGDGTK